MWLLRLFALAVTSSNYVCVVLHLLIDSWFYWGNMDDAFRTHIMQTKELGTCPVKLIGGCSFFYVRIINVYIMIAVSRNANVACAFKFVIEVLTITCHRHYLMFGFIYWFCMCTALVPFYSIISHISEAKDPLSWLLVHDFVAFDFLFLIIIIIYMGLHEWLWLIMCPLFLAGSCTIHIIF